MQIQPLGNRVLIKISAAEEKTSSGIIIPVTAQEKTNQGEVISVGAESSLTAGQKVIYDKYAGTEIKIDQEDFLIIETKDILAAIV